MSIFAQAATGMLAALQGAAGTAVIYSRGTDSVAVTAVPGSTTFELTNQHGVVERFVSRDFLVPAAVLILGGSAVLPERGDRIAEGAALYEVLGPADEPPYRFSDPQGITLRIHTKRIAIE